MPFSKSLKIITELEKIFSVGENGRNPLRILPMPQNVWSKGPEVIYF